MDEMLVIGRTRIGIVAEERSPQYKSGFFRWYLTPCCLAATTYYDEWHCCKECKEEADPSLGGLVEWDPIIEVFGDGVPYATFRENYDERFWWNTRM